MGDLSKWQYLNIQVMHTLVSKINVQPIDIKKFKFPRWIHWFYNSTKASIQSYVLHLTQKTKW
jgi:hypothetical protein